MLDSVSITLDNRSRVLVWRGPSPDACIGARITDLVHPYDQARVAEFFARVLEASGIVACEFVEMNWLSSRHQWLLRGLVLSRGQRVLLLATPQPERPLLSRTASRPKPYFATLRRVPPVGVDRG